MNASLKITWNQAVKLKIFLFENTYKTFNIRNITLIVAVENKFWINFVTLSAETVSPEFRLCK